MLTFATRRSELKKLHLEDQELYSSTLDQMEAMTLGQRIAVMNAGRMEQPDPNGKFTKARKPICRLFFPVPHPSICPRRVTCGNSVEGQTMFSLSNMELKIPKSISPPKLIEVTLGIRAEDFSLPTENEENLDLQLGVKLFTRMNWVTVKSFTARLAKK